MTDVDDIAAKYRAALAELQKKNSRQKKDRERFLAALERIERELRDRKDDNPVIIVIRGIVKQALGTET